MKKIVVLLAILFLVPSFGFAQSLQEENERLRKENKMLRQYLPLKRPWIINSYKRALPYPITIGLMGFGSFNFDIRDGYSNLSQGGGLGFRTKININRWFGVGVDLMGDITLNSFEFRPMVYFQHETLRAQKGFNPYFGVGASIGDFRGGIISAGVRYNTTQNMFVGTEISVGFGARNANLGYQKVYSYNVLGNRTVSISEVSFAIDTKVGIEIGYRF